MFRVAGINSSRSKIHDWNYRMNILNDQIVDRKFSRDERFTGAERSSPQRVKSGPRNLGYYDDEEREVSNRRDFRMSDNMVQRYQRNMEAHKAGNRRHFVKRSRMYQISDNEHRRDDGRNLKGRGYKETESHKVRRDCRHHYQEMDETDQREANFGNGRRNYLNYYQKIEEKEYKDKELRNERRDRYLFQEMKKTGYGETKFYYNKAIDRNRNTYPETNETGYGETEFYDNKTIDRNRRTYPETNKTCYRETEFRNERRDKYNPSQEMSYGYRETEFCDNKAKDQNRQIYPKMNETGYRETKFRKETKEKSNFYQDMNETSYGETEFYDSKTIYRNRRTYPETNETGYRETEFRNERRDKYNYFQEMYETGYGETEFYDNKTIDRNRKTYPETNKTGFSETEFRIERNDKYNYYQDMNETGNGETEFYDNKPIDRNKRTYPETNKAGYRESELRKERKDKYNYYHERNETDYRETEFYDKKAIDQNRKTYPKLKETDCRETEFRKERGDKYTYYQEMDETGYGETELYDNNAIGQNGRACLEKNEMGYMDRWLTHPDSTPYYPAPNDQYIDRGHGTQHSTMQCQSDSSTWNTQVSLTVQYPPVGETDSLDEKEEKKPRKVWWYTTSRVFSALLIISSLVSDWLEYSDMSDPIGDAKQEVKNNIKEVCIKNIKVNEATSEQFLYFTIAGTVLAALQLANIIYQIVQNHRLPPDTDIRDWLDERTEVFLVNAFVKFPQTFLIHRHEENICFKCGTEISPKKIKSLLNGLSSIVSSIWRYLTHVKVSTGTSSSCCNSFSCSKMCERCDTRCRNCLKSCLLDCIKCLCPCCCCCIDCETFFPCCCMYVICKNSRMSTKCVRLGNVYQCECKMCDPKAPSLLAELASIPIALVTFLYGLRVVKYFCIIDILDVLVFVFDTVVGFF